MQAKHSLIYSFYLYYYSEWLQSNRKYDRYNFRSGKYDFYRSFEFDIERDMNYIFFSPTSGNDMRFDDSGFYRVFLLDEDGKTVASALIEIIP